MRQAAASGRAATVLPWPLHLPLCASVPRSPAQHARTHTPAARNMRAPAVSRWSARSGAAVAASAEAEEAEEEENLELTAAPISGLSARAHEA